MSKDWRDAVQNDWGMSDGGAERPVIEPVNATFLSAVVRVLWCWPMRIVWVVASLMLMAAVDGAQVAGGLLLVLIAILFFFSSFLEGAEPLSDDPVVRELQIIKKRIR